MRELSAEQIQELESIVEDGIRYLVLREEDEVERIYRLQSPSNKQSRIATEMSHKYTWELRKNKDIKSKAEVEEEYRDQVDDLKKRSQVVKDRMDQARDALIEVLPDLPDGEKDPEAFRDALLGQQDDIQEIEEEAMEIQSDLMDIYSFSREHLVIRYKVSVLCALCWEKKVDGEWVNVWESFEEFEDDRGPHVIVLETEALKTFMPSAGFFGDWPLLISGGRGI